MVGRDTVTFRFRLDAKEMQRLIKALEQDAKRFGATMSQVKGQTDQLGPSLNNLGKNSATAAINFQTATQGMLNLSTAAVQTYTSISNLDRAANRLAQSKIAVARAEDLLAAKTLRLRELEEKGLGNSQKAINLTNELATAKADLAVKNDKLRIEEGALVDVQLLFITNIANVMISSIQTMKTLRDLQALSTIKATIAESGLITKMKALVLAQAAVSRNAIGTTTGFKGMTLAIKGTTLSVRGLMIALGPVAIAITAVTLAMQAYEENTYGFRDAIQSALPFLDDSNDKLKESEEILKNDRIAMEGYTSAIDNMNSSMKKLEPQHKLYLEMHRDAFLAMDKNSKLAAYYSAQLAGLRTGPQGFSTPSLVGGLPTGGGIAGTAITTGGGVSGPVSVGGGVAPTLGGVSTGGAGTPITVTGTNQLVDLANKYGSREQRFVYSMLPKQEKMNVLLIQAKAYMDQGNFGAANLYFAELEKVKTQPVMESDPQKIWENMQKGVNLKETGFRLAETRPENLLKPHDRAGDGGIFDFDLDNRQLVKTAIGVDIGAIAHTVNVNQAIRLGTIQKALSRFNPRYSKYITEMKSFTTGKAVKPGAGLMALLEGSGVETGIAEFEVRSRNPLYGQATGGRETELMREIRNLGGINDLGQTSATQLYQVARVFNPRTGNMDSPIRASQAFYDRIRIRDENTNRLRWGGKLREGMSIEDEGAVVGGYSSAKEFSRAAREKESRAFEQAQIFSDYFTGIGRVSRYNGLTGLRSQLNAIKQRADTVKNALSLAGLGYKRFNARTGLRYRYTMAEYNRFHKEWAEVRAFNDNQYAKATQINLLQEGFGLTGFTGSALTLPSLQQEVAKQDELMRTIGLDRTEAFQIIDTEGRGREEIDDRIRFKDRMNSMSTGVSVL